MPGDELDSMSAGGLTSREGTASFPSLAQALSVRPILHLRRLQ